MVSQVQSSGRNRQSIEFFIAEFGLVNSRHFDPLQKYQGQLMRLTPETLKAISDLSGFSAKFEFRGLRSAQLDLFGNEGHIVLEIERNTKPQDVSVRYARDRWQLQDVMGKTTDGLPALVKTDYHARLITPAISASIAQLLGIEPEAIKNLYVRINFKESVCGLICLEEQTNLLPDGAFSSFNVATPDIENQLQLKNSDSITAAAINSSLPQTTSEEKIAMANQESSWLVERTGTNDGQDDTATGGAVPEESAAAEEAPQATPNTPIDSAQTTTSENSTTDQAASAKPSSAAAAIEETLAAVERATAAIETAAANVDPASLIEPAPANFFKHKVDPAPVPQPRSATSRPESKRPHERPQESVVAGYSERSNNATRRENVDVQPKYATYSKSEVDAMLKQQAETILTALSSKMGQQQRTFQESVAAQEKSFNKLYERFVSQFESSKIKLESTTKTAQDNTADQLDSFKKNLSKELEQHRTQINKTVIPVAKALEDRPLKAPKEQTKNAAPTVVVKGSSPKQTKLLVATLVTAALSLCISIFSLLTLAEINTAITGLNKGTNATTK